MTAATFLWFAGVLAIVPISEARLGSLVNPNVRGSPVLYYNRRQARTIYQKVSKELAMNSHVVADCSEEKLNEMITYVMNVLHNPPRALNFTGTDMHIPDLRLTGLSVPERIFRVLSVQFSSASSTDTLRMVINVPRVEANFTSQVFLQSPSKVSHPCSLLYVVENVRITVQASHESGNKNARLRNASVLNFEPGSIRTQVSVACHNLHAQTIPKGSQEWLVFKNMVYRMMPTPFIATKIADQFVDLLVS